MNSLSKLTVILSLCFSLLACSSEFPQYGVLLWSPNDSKIKTGSLVGIINESQIQKLYKLQLPGSTLEEALSADLWRVRKFDSQGQAEEFREKNKDLLAAFATCSFKALPLRKSADRMANIIYKLNEQEVVKIISKASDLVEIAGKKNYWYEVLTESGFTGFTFGANLDLFNVGADNGSLQIKAEDIDIISRLKSISWRPRQFSEMIKNSKFDLSEFQADRGFFLDALSHTYRLSLKKKLIEGEYSTFTQTEPGTWKIDGSSLVLSFKGDGSLTINYEFDSKEEVQELIPMKDNIQELVNNEIARRQIVIRRMSFNGADLVNEKYGVLQMRGTKFNWTGFASLSPQFIPAGAGEAGNLDFDTALSGNITSRYNGVLNFTFEGVENPVPFFYSLSPAGIVLVPGNAADVKDGKIDKIPEGAPTMLFKKE